jgi:type IV pilus assembly protein PilA
VTNALQALRKRDREDGFTLIELMVVVMIIAILVAIAIPSFFSARKRAQDASPKSSLQVSLTNAQAIYTDTQAYPATADLVAALIAEEPNVAYVISSVVSAGPKSVSVLVAGDVVTLVAESDSGKCFWLRNNATPGTATSGTFKAEGVAASSTCSGGGTPLTTYAKA